MTAIGLYTKWVRPVVRFFLPPKARHLIWVVLYKWPEDALYGALDLWGRRQLARAGALALLDSIGTDRAYAALLPDYGDLWFLYREVRRRRPRCILEFGSGWSTYVLAAALHHNRRDDGGDAGRLVSVDAEPKWADVTRATMPAVLAPYAEIVACPAVPLDYDGVAAWRHENMPDVSPDFVYLDGPPLTDERAVAVDLLSMEDRIKAGALLVIDYRQDNADFLKARFRRRWRFRDPGLLYKMRKAYELIG